MWSGTVYTSRQEFNGYLKSKGLSYKTWVARNPGAAPWEPDEITIGAIKVRASTKAREDWVVRLPLAAIGLMLATGCALLLSRGLRPVMARVPRAVFSPRARVGKGSAGTPTASASVRRLGVVASGVTRHVRVSAPLTGAVRADARLLAKLIHERNISVGYVAFGLLAGMTSAMLALFVVRLLFA